MLMNWASSLATVFLIYNAAPQLDILIDLTLN